MNTTYSNDYDFQITGVSSSSNPQNNTLLFCKRIKEDTFATFAEFKNCVIIVPERHSQEVDFLRIENFVIGAKNPRIEYARILQYILQDTRPQSNGKSVCEASFVGRNFKVGTETVIGSNVVIGNHVHIGCNCIIEAGVVINDFVRIADYTIVRANAVLGSQGFGFEKDEQGIPIRVPHLGGVEIGSYVEIGAMAIIAAGTIEPTVIEDYVKIDAHVHIAHNCHIGKGCLITACAEISGSVKIGEYSWLGPNCSIINKISIGKYCLVGIGAVLKKSIPDEMVVAGDPARSLEEIKIENNLQKNLLEAYKNGKLKFIV